MFSAFDSIRIISLPARLDRREEVGQEMARIGLKVGEGSVRMFDAIKPAEAGGFPSVGARGCYLSHLHVLREAIRDGTRHLLVFEDDAMFTREVENAGALLAHFKSDEWDFLYPGHLMLPVVPGPLHWIPKDDWLMCTHAYAVNQRVLKPLVAYLEDCLARPEGHTDGGPMHIDAAYNYFMRDNPQVLTYRSSKSVVIQRSSQSDVAPPKALHRLVPPVALRLARKAKSWLRARYAKS
jgi:hypothetical protein